MERYLTTGKVIIIFILVGFALYLNSFSNQMFWDDHDGIVNNQYIKNWEHFPKFFSENLIAGSGLASNYWRPALLTLFSIEWHLWQENVIGYHIVNTSIHIIDSILLFLILFYIFKNRKLAFFTALIFLIHPLQTEAVTYVSGLGDSLSTFFILGGLLCFIQFRISDKKQWKSPYYYLSLLSYAAALMSKETAIIMPGLIILCDYFIQNQNLRLGFKEKLKKVSLAVWPFFVIGIGYIVLRATTLNFINTFNLYNEENLYTSNFHIRLFTFFKILSTYFGLLVLPLGLHMERSMELVTSIFSPSVIFGGVIFILLLYFAFARINRTPIISFGILWFLICLAPTSNLLIPINGLIYEHWLYMPLVGFFFVLIHYLILAFQKNKKKWLFAIFGYAFIIFISIITIQRNNDWKDPITFYNQTLKYAPNSYRIVNNLGMAYDEVGDFVAAEEKYKYAISLHPNNPVAYHNLGNTLKKTNRNLEALKNFQKAVNLQPDFFFSYPSLINLSISQKEYDNALYYLNILLKREPLNENIKTYIEEVNKLKQ